MLWYSFSKLTAAKETAITQKATTQIKGTLPKTQFQPENVWWTLGIFTTTLNKFWRLLVSHAAKSDSERVTWTTWPAFQPLLKVDCKPVSPYVFLRNSYAQCSQQHWNTSEEQMSHCGPTLKSDMEHKKTATWSDWACKELFMERTTRAHGF